jgi:hypothetical protein
VDQQRPDLLRLAQVQLREGRIRLAEGESVLVRVGGLFRGWTGQLGQ